MKQEAFVLPKIGKRLSLAQQAHAAIKKAIVYNELKPGELLREESLAATLGISRTPLRAALKQLQFEKLIVVDASKHAFVSDLEPEKMGEVFAFRLAVEPATAKAACTAITQKELGLVEECLRRHEAFIKEENLDKIIACEMEFNSLIARGSKNEFLIDSMETISTYMQRYILQSQTVSRDVTESVVEHRMILEAIANADVGQAEELTRQHIFNVARRCRFTLSS